MPDENPLAEYQTTEERTDSHELSVDELLQANSARLESTREMERQNSQVQEVRTQEVRRQEMAKPPEKTVDEILAERAKQAQPALNRSFIEKERER